jgi:sterol desaturase/sphingolipid hydroxylase (fatty acid hydroxylase superfamily)
MVTLRGVISGLVVGGVIYFGSAVPFMIAEHVKPARKLPRSVLWRDLLAYVGVRFNEIVAGALGGALAAAIYQLHPFKPMFRPPLWLLLPLGIVLSDLWLYLIHRFMHIRQLWRTHRWHHSPEHMYWLAGCRASFVHTCLYAMPSVAFLFIDASAYRFREIAILFLIGPISNHWMHSNWKVEARWLEWLIITPRAHRVHHSNNPSHFGRNFGSVFSVWDHLFGTYLSPDAIEGEVEFGIPEQVSAPRLLVGV